MLSSSILCAKIDEAVGSQRVTLLITGTNSSFWVEENTSHLQVSSNVFGHTKFYIWRCPKTRGSHKSSIVIGLSIINHPFLGITIYGTPNGEFPSPRLPGHSPIVAATAAVTDHATGSGRGFSCSGLPQDNFILL